VLLVVNLVFTATVFAVQYNNGKGSTWVKNEENWTQWYYKGTAYARKGSRAQITYYRNGTYLGGAYAYLDSRRQESSMTDTCKFGIL